MIHELTKQLMKQNGGFIPSKVLLAEVRAQNPKRWARYNDTALLRGIAEALREVGLDPRNGRIGDRVVRGYGKHTRPLIVEWLTLKNNSKEEAELAAWEQSQK
jgi:hypothetical protein